MKNNFRMPLRIVFYRDGQDWVAHCLEFDLMGDGATQPEALDQLSEAIALQIESTLEAGNPRNLFKPADGRFFAMFAAGRNVASAELHLEADYVTIDETETRQYDDSDLACV